MDDRAELLAVIAQAMDGVHRSLSQALRMQSDADDRLWTLERSIEGVVPLAQARKEREAMQYPGVAKPAPKTPIKAAAAQGEPSQRIADLQQQRDKAAALLDKNLTADQRARVQASLEIFDKSLSRAKSLPRVQTGAGALARAKAADPPSEKPPTAKPAGAPGDPPTNDPPTEAKPAPADAGDKPSEGAPFTAAEKAVADADHAARMKMPAGWFLQGGDVRKYPVRDNAGELSKALLTHAEERASANKEEKVASEARALLRQHFSEKSAPAPKPPAETPRKRRWL